MKLITICRGCHCLCVNRGRRPRSHKHETAEGGWDQLFIPGFYGYKRVYQVNVDNMELNIEHNMEKYMEHNMDQYMEHNMEQYMEHNMEQYMGHNMEQYLKQNMELNKVQNIENQYQYQYQYKCHINAPSNEMQYPHQH